MKTGRNEKCPCGSEKKYKRCCLGKDINTMPEKELRQKFEEKRNPQLRRVY